MDDAQRKLLEDHKTIILPDHIDNDVYQMIAEAAILFPDDEIVLYCRGDGGDARDAFAIDADNRHHGALVGLLQREAHSSHVTSWAGCAVRYVYPHSAIGVHRIGSQDMRGTLTADVMEFMKKDYEDTENAVSKILAGISDKDVDFWNRQQRLGNVTYKTIIFYAVDLIKMGMALPIADRPAVDRLGDNGKKPVYSTYNPPPIKSAEGN